MNMDERAAVSAGCSRGEKSQSPLCNAMRAAAGKRGREVDEGEGDEDWSAYAMPTTLSWSKLPASTLELFEEGISCVEEDCKLQAKKRRTATHTGAGIAQRVCREAPPSGLHVLAACAGLSSDAGECQTAQAGPAQAGPAQAGPAQAPAKNGRAQLDDESAVRIFLAKYASAEAMSSKSDLSGKLALQYGVTAKAVRDIWNMRTWKKATQPYWNVQPATLPMHNVWLMP